MFLALPTTSRVASALGRLALSSKNRDLIERFIRSDH